MNGEESGGRGEWMDMRFEGEESGGTGEGERSISR